ncbi:hypothetical protein K439DRAFT_1657659 [Ramaria rubella]|nr:hypothetical protein K439DRAFT_1657659 [Ramaria rubella]
MSSIISPRREQLSKQRNDMYAKLVSALEDEADPLGTYNDLVKWTLQNYANHAESGLLELLEESVSKFKDDARYKTTDFRYVKLWILFANYVDKPTLVYAYMMEMGIGKLYALFFEEYAEALEREGRFSEAETVVTLGLRTQAKPLKHLQNFQTNYQFRRTVGEPLPMKVPPFREDACSNDLMIIRTDPLRNILPRRADSNRPIVLSVTHANRQDISMNTTHAVQPMLSTRLNAYAHLNAPPPPGKKPEKLRFDLTLLLESDGTEYSFEEARARHLGLLGKKWPPPPPPNAAVPDSSTVPNCDAIPKDRAVKVDFNDHSSKAARPTRRQSVTVTINTKQALEDVFDMYNSPVKENSDAEEAVDKPPKTVETAANLHTPGPARPVFQDENAGTATKPRAFQPYVDQKRENATPGPLKFVPITTKTPGSNAFTPNVARKALVTKELVTPVPAFKVVRPQTSASTPAVSRLNSLAEDKEEPNNIDVFGGDDVTSDEFTEEITNVPPPLPPPRPFIPFVDDDTDSQVLPPTSRSDNPPAPAASKILKFQVHRDEDFPLVSTLRRPVIGKGTPSQPVFRPTHQKEQIPPSEGVGSWTFEKDVENDFQEVEDRHRFGTSGRFANFDVMTPITERTFEFTSTRAIDTPGSDRSSMFDKGFMALDAQDAAEKLAIELQQEETNEGRAYNETEEATPYVLPPGLMDVDERASGDVFSSFDQSRAPFRVSDGFTIEPNYGNLVASAVVESTTANLSEEIAGESGFDPPNPCNPSDPEIISKLLSLFPEDPNHRDLHGCVANNLNAMQRFAAKLSRKGSAINSGRSSDSSDGLSLELDGDMFEVFDKLGEGGFGAVFIAKNMNKMRLRSENEDEDEDEDEGIDADDGLIAIKAVRPTNLWESYVLRAVLSAVPDDLCRSIIRPHCLYAFKDESFLILDLCQQGTLLETVNRATEVGIGQPGGGLDELLAMFFTVELLRILQGLHDHGFIHGDLKIDNCMIRLEDVPGGTSAWSSTYSPLGEGGWASKGLKLIDFGRTIDTRFYPPGQTFIADWITDGRDCIEMRQGSPWTFQADYSGLASVAYCMLFGKYIETTETVSPEGIRKLKSSQPMKRYWQMDLWNRLFDALLNPQQLRRDASLPITDELVALRHELENWIQDNCNKAGKNLKGMLKKIEIAYLRKMPRK